METDANGCVTPIDNLESKNSNPDENEPMQPQAATDSDEKKTENDSSAENQAPSSSVAADPQKRVNAENKVDRFVGHLIISTDHKVILFRLPFRDSTFKSIG